MRRGRACNRSVLARADLADMGPSIWAHLFATALMSIVGEADLRTLELEVLAVPRLHSLPAFSLAFPLSFASSLVWLRSLFRRRPAPAATALLLQSHRL